MNRLEYLLLFFVAVMMFTLSQTAFSPVFDISRYPLPKPAKIKKDEPKSLLFLGDIMLGRYVENKMESDGEEYPFKYIKTLLASSTYIVANLEGPIPKVHTPTPMYTFRFSFKESVAPLLSKMNIHAVSLANNHSVDWGEEGYVNTKTILDKHGVRSFGHSQSMMDDVYEINLDGKMVTTFGINMTKARWNNDEAIEATLKVVNAHPESHIVAFLHWGDEYSHRQNSKQQELARILIDNGVDTVIGAHPHVIQGIEKYKDSHIFYSLGNFIFDQFFSDDVEEGYAIKMKHVEGNLIFELIPYVSERSQPRLADEENRKKILDNLASYSDEELKSAIVSGIVK